MTSPAKHEPDRPSSARRERLGALVTTLAIELNQAERSAALHCRREARRLGDIAPAAALLACARHADDAMRELGEVLATERLKVGRLGAAIGSLFSLARTAVLDRLIENERSYRATLLGLRHGVDLVRLLRHAADADGRVELGGFCTRWLADREPRIAEVERAMSWFAHHADVAVDHPVARSMKATLGAMKPRAT